MFIFSEKTSLKMLSAEQLFILYWCFMPLITTIVKGFFSLKFFKISFLLDFLYFYTQGKKRKINYKCLEGIKIRFLDKCSFWYISLCGLRYNDAIALTIFLFQFSTHLKCVPWHFLSIWKFSFPPVLLPPPAVKADLQVHSNFHSGRSHVYSGLRRSFFCRIRRCKISVKEEHECLSTSKKKGIIILRCQVI